MSHNKRSGKVLVLAELLMMGSLLAACLLQFSLFVLPRDPWVAPNKPSNPATYNLIKGQNFKAILSWKGGDPYGDTVTYTVYLEANNPNPTRVVSYFQNEITYIANNLARNTIYYWQIVARDALGVTTPGPIWSFTTLDGSSSKALFVTAGEYHTCAITTDGGVKCWGDNEFGQLGDGTQIGRWNPVSVIGLSLKVTDIVAGSIHNCTLTEGGVVKCWGDGSDGQLGDGTQTGRSTPVNVIGLSSGVDDIAAGMHYTCALTSEGGVKCWGRHDLGQLWNGTTIPRLTPVVIPGLSSGVEEIAGGGHYTCALIGGGVKCWGIIPYEQEQFGSLNGQWTPVAVPGLPSGVEAIEAGGSIACALVGNVVKCWGSNNFGQLGDGTIIPQLTPVAVSGLSSGVKAIAVGGTHNCALTNMGGVKCWGRNIFGQLGDGTTIQRLTPVDVVGLSSGVKAIAVGYGHTCALTNIGGVKCWGDNGNGQLGDGTTTDRWTPVDVVGFP
jgi:alpha-tubulin suppressor-like RCC1 family protein